MLTSLYIKESENRMRILLVNPTTRKYQKGLSVKAQAPMALLCLASVLRENGHTIKIFDHNVENNGINWCLKFNPELIGFTSFTGPMIRDALTLSGIFRKYLEVPIVWGGVHASLLPVQTVNDPRVDMCVVGEGEETIVELADNLERTRELNEIKGLVWKKVTNGSTKIIENAPRAFIKDLDALPFPAWDLLDAKKYQATSMGLKRSSQTLFAIQSSRGCPFQCGFCYNTIFNKRTWRFKSAERVIEELSFLKEKFKVDRVNFKDDNFVVNKKRAVKICKGIYKDKMDINFAIDCRVDLLTTPLAKYLKVAGCDQIFFGVESGSPRILRFIKKGITLDQAYKSIKICRDVKIQSTTSFVIGFPTETLEDVIQTKNFINHLKPDNLLLKIFVPYPGSFLYDYVVNNALFSPPTKLEDWAIPWTNSNYKISQVPPEILNKLNRRIISSFYLKKGPFMTLKLLKNVLSGKLLPHRLFLQIIQGAIAEKN